jgi:hypothetical protein
MVLTADIKHVYILGAGSSISHSANIFPNINNFFIKAKENGIFTKEAKKDYDKLHDFIKRVYNLDIYKSKTDLDCEKVFTFLELEIERKYDSFISTRHQLFKLIKNLFIALESQLNTNQGDYNEFYERLHFSDTIITFNWDTLLDNILQREYYLERIASKYPLHSAKKTIKPQYLNFLDELSGYSRIIKEREGLRQEELPVNKCYLIKLHGSIDWTYCKNEDCDLYRKVFPVRNAAETGICHECREHKETLFVPPVLNKPIRKFPFIRKLWNIAGDELEKADEIIIWGYSLPPTDFYSDWLLRRLRNNKGLKGVSIINPGVIGKKKAIVNKRQLFIKRFKQMFPKGFPKEKIFLYEDYADYIQSITVEEKYDISY